MELILSHDRGCIKMNRRRDIAAILLGVSVAVILWLTILSRSGQATTQVIIRPFHELKNIGSLRLKDLATGRGQLVGNIVLFIPVGFLFPVVVNRKKWYFVLTCGVLFSLMIECIQLVSKRGCFDLDDILFNVIGVMIGYGCLRVIEEICGKLKMSKNLKENRSAK